MPWLSKGVLAQDPYDQSTSHWNNGKTSILKCLHVKTEGTKTVYPHLMSLLFSSLFSDITPSPSAYRLISKDDEDLEMCLITDYSPEKLTLNSADKQTNAIVEVATSENKQEVSYLSTYWAKKDEMQCGANHEGFGELEGKDPESGNGIFGCVYRATATLVSVL